MCDEIRNTERHMNFFRINPLVFFISFAIGLLFVIFTLPSPHIIIKFPSPYNISRAFLGVNPLVQLNPSGNIL